MTVGHQKVVNKIRAVARLEKGDPFVYLSHTHQDKKDKAGYYKDPLDYSSKVNLAQKAFGKIVVRTSARRIQDCPQRVKQ